MRPQKLLLLPLLFVMALFGQTPTTRPKASAQAAFVQKQVKITSLTGVGFTYAPASTQPAGGDVYLGQTGGGIPATGQISVGSTGAITVTIQDSSAFVVAKTWSLAASSTFNLNVLYGALMTGGFTITCTDGSGGTACAASTAEIFWSE